MAAALALGTVPILLLAALAVRSASFTPLGILGLVMFLTLLVGTGIGLMKTARRQEV